MSKKFKHLNLSPHWQQYFSKYPQGYTIIENLIDWVSQVDDMVDSYNELTDHVDNFKEAVNNTTDGFREELDTFLEQFDDNLAQNVIATLSEWQNSGFLDIVIDEALNTKYHEMDERLTTQLAQTNQDLSGRGVNILNLPAPFVSAVGDGVTDDTQAINTAIQNFPKLVFPPTTYLVTDTIRVGQRGRNIQGTSENVRDYGESAVIMYDGPLDRTKAVVLLGGNDVGVEPTADGSDIVFKNFLINANEKAGFGVYGTLLTNESQIENNAVRFALEYNMYFARSWYATYSKLLGDSGIGKGLAFGMPLELQDGTTYNWTVSPEMNNVKIDDVRAHRNGRYFSEQNQGTFNPDNENHVRQGYGLGFGVGNGFTVSQFLSEINGGVNLYVLTDSQPMKTIRNGYLENSNSNAAISAENRVGMVIEHLHDTGGPYTIENVYFSFATGGGILFKGDVDSRQVWLKNSYQPRFLKSNDLTDVELYSRVLKENVSYGAGLFNTDERLAQYTEIVEIDTKAFWSSPINYLSGGRHIVYARLKEGEVGQPSTGMTFLGGSLNNITRQYPTLNQDWEYFTHVQGEYNQLQQSGTGQPENPIIELKIVTMPTTAV